MANLKGFLRGEYGQEYVLCDVDFKEGIEMKRLMVVACVWVVCVISVSPALAKTIGRETLQGMRGVNVLVEGIKEEAEKDGLTTRQLQTDVEVELRKAGIRVLTEEQSLKSPGKPYLYLYVITLKREGGREYVYCIELSLRQNVYLSRKRSMDLIATTFGPLGGVGVASVAHMSNHVRKIVRDQVNRFINAYLAVNPK